MPLNFQCYSLDDMLTVFNINHSVGANMSDFKELCPAFIQQVKSGACKESDEIEKEVHKDMGKSKFNSMQKGRKVLQKLNVDVSQNLVVYYLTKNSRHFYQNVNGNSRHFCLDQAEDF